MPRHENDNRPIYGISNREYRYLISYEYNRPIFGDLNEAMRLTRFEAYEMFNKLERQGYDDLTVDVIF